VKQVKVLVSDDSASATRTVKDVRDIAQNSPIESCIIPKKAIPAVKNPAGAGVQAATCLSQAGNVGLCV
jgi:hypothetical protein